MAISEKETKRIISRNNLLKNNKSNFENYWQLLAEFIMPRKGEFTATITNGEVLNNNLFDSTAIRANRLMASSLIGILWPTGAKSFRLNGPDGIDDNKDDNKEYYEAVTDRLATAMDSSRAGLPIALDEFMLDQGAFGTSGISVFNGKKTDLMFKAWNVQQMSIDEGEDGFIDTVYFEFEWPLRRVVEKYGLENLSEASKEAWENGDMESPTTILHAIEPRMEEDQEGFGNQNMPFRSVHIELKDSKVLREGGFEELPVMVGRFRKSISEIYGRGSGMDALPDIIELNAVWEAVTNMVDKEADPPLAVLDDGTLGGGTIDTSPGAINVFTPTGRASNESPVEVLVTNGEIKSLEFLINSLTQNITEHFNIDRLLDLNNQSTMTATEVIERSQFRNQSLNSLIARLIAEVFTPLIERSFNLLFREGKLGVFSDEKMAKAIESGAVSDNILLKMQEAKARQTVEIVGGVIIPSPQTNVIEIPDDIAEAILRGENVFDITYITPAARTVQAEEAQGIIKTWEFAAQAAQVDPEIMDNLDADVSIRELSKILGAPSSILKNDKEVEAERQGRAAAMQQQQQAEQVQQGAATAKDLAVAGAQQQVA